MMQPALDPLQTAQSPTDAGWRRRVAVNLRRKIASIRGFRLEWFSPRAGLGSHLTAAHIGALNDQIGKMRAELAPHQRRMELLAKRNDRASQAEFFTFRQFLAGRVLAIQYLWDFFFDIFNQRRSIYASYLDRCDRVVTECYRLVFRRLGAPAPWLQTPSLCYLEKAYSPATIRRGVRFLLRRGVITGNPFPVIKIPYDRVPNPWTLTSLLHEVGHNIHGDVPNHWRRTRIAVYRRLRHAGMPPRVAANWSRWHKEMLADLLGILLGGPAVVYSLVDLMSRRQAQVTGFRPNAVHPTPYLRVLISTYALKRLGFGLEAERIEHAWKKRYPLAQGSNIPPEVMETADQATCLAVDTLLWTPYPELNGRRWIDLISYTHATHRRVLRAAAELLHERPARDLPSRRHVISAAVYAFHRRPDSAARIQRAFHRSLESASSASLSAGASSSPAEVVVVRQPRIVVIRRGRGWGIVRRPGRVRIPKRPRRPIRVVRPRPITRARLSLQTRARSKRSSLPRSSQGRSTTLRGGRASLGRRR